MTAEYGAQTGCEESMSRYIHAIVYMERIRDRVDEQYEEAPGRLRDVLEQIPGAIDRMAAVEPGTLEIVKKTAKEAVGMIDQATMEMMKRKTKKVAQYLPGYHQQLHDSITRVERELFREAIASASECLCGVKA